MLDYLIERMIILIENNLIYASHEWGFITAFFMSLCFNKHLWIKQKGIEQIGKINKFMFISELPK